MLKPNLLIVEDNENISELIEKALKSEFEVSIASNIRSASILLRNSFFDLIILDVILPDGNGISFCNYLKSTNHYSKTKIIVLTKKQETKIRVESFESGADDYLPKPFAIEELTLRIKKQLNLLNIGNNGLKYKSLELNPEQRSVSVKGVVVYLSKREYFLLEYLLKNPLLASNDNLITYLKTQQRIQTNPESIRISIKRLRDKLEKYSGMKVIKNRYGTGYFIAV